MKTTVAIIACITFTLFGRAAELTELKVSDFSGHPVVLKDEPGQVIFFMGTWCPYSKNVVNFLNAPTLKPYLAKARIIFVFEKTEWDHARALYKEQLDDKSITEDEYNQVLETIAAKEKENPLVDPTFIENPLFESFQIADNGKSIEYSIPGLLDWEAGNFEGISLMALGVLFSQFTSTDNVVEALQLAYPSHFKSDEP